MAEDTNNFILNLDTNKTTTFVIIFFSLIMLMVDYD